MESSHKMNDPTRDLFIFEIGETLQDGLQSPVPTVCLLVADELVSAIDLEALIGPLVRSGCRHFMTWGRVAAALHDAVDFVLEDNAGDFLEVVSTSHENEPAIDVAWFLINAAVPGEKNLRCCIGYLKNTKGLDDLLKCVQEEMDGN